MLLAIRSTIEGGRGCNKCVPVLRGNGTKIAPTGYIFDQPPGGMSWVRGKLAGHVGGHVVLSPEEGVLVTSPGTESSYPRPSQLLNNSSIYVYCLPIRFLSVAVFERSRSLMVERCSAPIVFDGMNR